MDFDLDHYRHTLDDVAPPERHDPDGQWFYGLDTSVDPPVWRDRVLYRRSVEVSPGVVGHDFWRATPGREPDP